MDIRLLNDSDFSVLHRAFCHAFSSNEVEFNPTEEEFSYRLYKKLNVDYQLSGGAFDGNEMIGFILHTSNIYQGIPTAFNGGTGVIPGFRNQRTGEELYEFLLPKIIAASIARILLEVIDTNEKAIRLYEKIGFYFKRRFLCYKLTQNLIGSPSEQVQEGTLGDVDEDFADFEPSFVDSKNQLLRGNEKVLVVKNEGYSIGFIAFQPAIGRISQIAVHPSHRGKGIGKALMGAAKKESKKTLTIMNVPDDEFSTHRFLASCGFENQVNQFEMELII